MKKSTQSKHTINIKAIDMRLNITEPDAMMRLMSNSIETFVKEAPVTNRISTAITNFRPVTS